MVAALWLGVFFMNGIYDQHLGRNAANFVALSPVSFVERSAEVFGDMPAVVHGARPVARQP